MPLARRVDATCPNCDDDSDVWMFEKDEPTIIKEHYTCESCGCERTERRQD
jgi:C4-type Zn-finger protein